MKRDFERRSREMKADFERRTAESKKRTATSRSRRAKPKPEFNAVAAPSPARCLAYFLIAAKAGNSIDELMKYVPDSKQRVLQVRQKSYDPELARERRARLKQDHPEYDTATLDHLTDSPYAGFIKFHQRLALKVKKINSVKVNRNRATIGVVIKSDAIVNGIPYPNGTATVVMIGEGHLWRFKSYKESELVSR